MKRTLVAVMILAAAPLAMANLVDMALDSSNAANIADITGFVTDDITGVEVAQKYGLSGWMYWDGPKFSFPAQDFTAAGIEIQVESRYHQTDNLESDPPRYAYDDANLWLLIEDINGNLADLAWGDPWTQDEWKTQVYPLDGVVFPDGFDATQVVKVVTRSTNWGAADPSIDYINFSHLTVTPEPASLALLALGGLALIRRR